MIIIETTLYLFKIDNYKTNSFLSSKMSWFFLKFLFYINIIKCISACFFMFFFFKFKYIAKNIKIKNHTLGKFR